MFIVYTCNCTWAKVHPSGMMSGSRLIPCTWGNSERSADVLRRHCRDRVTWYLSELLIDFGRLPHITYTKVLQTGIHATIKKIYVKWLLQNKPHGMCQLNFDNGVFKIRRKWADFCNGVFVYRTCSIITSQFIYFLPHFSLRFIL